MTKNAQSDGAGEVRQLAAGLRTAIGRLVDEIVGADAKRANEDFDHLLGRARDLFRRKQSMEGSKSETRDLLGELLFTRLRRAMRQFVDTDDARAEIKAAEWLMGALFSAATLNDFAVAIDRAILQSSMPRDYSFAGLADFISLDEVLQLLGAGKHTGCLSIEKDDNRVDVYFHSGLVAYFDPHRLARRVLPSPDRISFREIGAKLLDEAEQRRTRESVPIVATLAERGFFKASEARDMMRVLGSEVLYEFLREEGMCAFFYRRLNELPAFARDQNLRCAITPLLLEGHKRVDDWRSMLKLFPDPDAKITPLPDIFARIGGLDLGVLEIKMLSLINGENSPRSLVAPMGLPLFDVYQTLVRFARDGVLLPPGGLDALKDLTMSVEESMQLAFEALDANDDATAMNNALDKVLGGDDKAEQVGYALDILMNGTRRDQQP